MKIKWGIIGLGGIATKFADALMSVESGELVAVASRSKEKAIEFGSKYQVSNDKCYGSYDELVRDTDIDVVYIAVPHIFHKELSILCLNNNKAVLCEKPVAMNSVELEEVVELARNKGLFYMEAMKTRFMPVIKKVKSIIDAGDIGEIRLISADYGFNVEYDANSRLYNKALGGGALLDVGIYNVSFSTYIYNELPKEIYCSMEKGIDEVDLSETVCLTYSNGRKSNLFSAINLKTVNEAIIIGTNGIIRIPNYQRADTSYININNKEEKIYIPHRVNGMEYEIEEVNMCLKDNKTESDIMSLEDSIKITRLMDSIFSVNN